MCIKCKEYADKHNITMEHTNYDSIEFRYELLHKSIILKLIEDKTLSDDLPIVYSMFLEAKKDVTAPNTILLLEAINSPGTLLSLSWEIVKSVVMNMDSTSPLLTRVLDSLILINDLKKLEDNFLAYIFANRKFLEMSGSEYWCDCKVFKAYRYSTPEEVISKLTGIDEKGIIKTIERNIN
jgi:hypothetical protein